MLKAQDELVRGRDGSVVQEAVAGPGLIKGMGVGLLIVVPFWAWVVNLAITAL